MSSQAGGAGTPGQRDIFETADMEDRRFIREALDETLVVEAAAGTG